MSEKKPIINFILSEKSWKTVSPLLEDEITLALEKTSRVLSEDFSQREVSVVLTTDEEVHTLNKTFRHQDKATNVLSFPSDEKPELGDIILAYETVLKEAKELGISTLHHTLHLIIHGFLHLLGYDHEADHEAEEMESLEIQILKTLNIQNPYEDK
ncbi:rRNA maturation RNase YbeY [Geitlerinema splendidum]|jgi:probable rRNA maturation factor|nr:rRNA maturation RNase YbeY [Geitlerinema splendidum]